ncbi:MAG: alpha/beta hydrolase fold domain-containing protein [Clostridia bacterium]|nr:alpha/beta hydrolase fold domain-containing protein [Clostridia bacterium]
MVKQSLTYGPLPEHRLDFYDCGCPDAPLFIFFHGGGLESGDKGDGKIPYFLDLMENGISAATADYRMYPKAVFPQFISDAALCTAWCIKNLPHGKVFVGGSSAGAYLTMMLAFDHRYLAEHGIDAADKEQIAGYFSDGGQPTVHFNVLRERGLDNRLIRVDEAAPVYFIGTPSAPERLPRYRFIFADNDMVNRPEQNLLMVRTMLHLGYPEQNVSYLCMNGYGHTEYNGAADTDGRPLYAKMIRAFILGE